MSTRTRTDKNHLILFGVLVCGLAAVAAVLLVAGGLWLFGKGKAGPGGGGGGLGGLVSKPVHEHGGPDWREAVDAYYDNPVAAKTKYAGTRWRIRARVVDVTEPGTVHVRFGELKDPDTRIEMRGGEALKVKKGETYYFEADLEGFRPGNIQRVDDFGRITFTAGVVVGPAPAVSQKGLSDLIEDAAKKPK